jgi:hypothetical protein
MLKFWAEAATAINSKTDSNTLFIFVGPQVHGWRTYARFSVQVRLNSKKVKWLAIRPEGLTIHSIMN